VAAGACAAALLTLTTTGVAMAAPSAPVAAPQNHAPTITEYPAPDQQGVFYPALGPDKNIWDVSGGSIFRILTHAPYTVTEFDVPGGYYLRDIIAGADGNLWFTDARGSYDGKQEPGKIGRITPAGKITEFSLPNPQSTPTPIMITAGPGGNLYFTEDCASACYPGGGNVGVGRITPFGSDARVQASVTQVVPKTSTPCASQACDTLYWAITVGPDGSLWIGAGASVDRLSLLPGNKLTRYPVPGAAKYAALDITTGIDGKVWFTGATATEPLGRITPNGTITLYPLPSPGNSTIGIRTGPDGNLWFAAGGDSPNGLIGTFSPFSPGHVTYYPVPNGAVPYGFANGNCDNTIWFTDTSANPSFIGRIQLHTPAGVLGCVYSKFGNAQGQ
jgi:streptogramin lyase